jgi:peptidoglycan/LPS O-acetylase OafA/YrhL
MHKGLSIYLDLLRLVAAMEVFFYHLSGFKSLNVDRAFWNTFGHEAVTVFFVLSGFVITHAASSKTTSFFDFSVSRITRVYSVAIPALVLTLVFDKIGQAISTELYGTDLITQGSSMLRLLIGFLMMNESWVSVQMLSNTPYWSISYEFWYYALFGAMLFLKGTARVVTIFAVCVIAGPRILILFPIWLLGSWVYHETLSKRIPKWLAVFFFLQPILVLWAYHHFGISRMSVDFFESILGKSTFRNSLVWSRHFATDFFLGVSVALHLMSAKTLSGQLEYLLRPFETVIRSLADKSFTLYLVHQPTLLLVGTILLPLMSKDLIGPSAAVVTLVTVFWIASVTEKQRHHLTPYVQQILRKLTKLMGSRFEAHFTSKRIIQ